MMLVAKARRVINNVKTSAPAGDKKSTPVGESKFPSAPAGAAKSAKAGDGKTSEGRAETLAS